MRWGKRRKGVMTSRCLRANSPEPEDRWTPLSTESAIRAGSAWWPPRAPAGLERHGVLLLRGGLDSLVHLKSPTRDHPTGPRPRCQAQDRNRCKGTRHQGAQRLRGGNGRAAEGLNVWETVDKILKVRAPNVRGRLPVHCISTTTDPQARRHRT